ncbi:MAG: hypothetical protein GXP24_04180 [Planctomycetes bacterium]|nr:hypothetical protein [Planctomycetota bacterium]
MSRIFPSLAAISLGLFLVTIIMGLTIGDLYEIPPSEATFRWRSIHMLTGTSAAIAVLFVHSVAITYFVGTSRWCKEVTETYRLDPKPLQRSAWLKRKTFLKCVMGMLSVVGVAALGAASDPGTGGKATAEWASIHLGGAFLGLAFIAWTYYRAWLNIVANQSVIQEIVEAVAVIRRERGLDTEPQTAVTSVPASSEQ